MKLLVKTSFYYLLFSIPVLILSGFICYYLITIEVRDSNNELLLNRKNVIQKYLIKKDTLALNFINKNGEAQIIKTNKKVYENGLKTIFKDTLIFDTKENELAPNRMISSLINSGNNSYQLKLWTPTIEFDELLEGILYLLILILFSLFLISLLINFWVSKTLWKPFYVTLNSLKTFKASEKNTIEFKKSSVKEFADLNLSLGLMMNKMIVDYNSQKKFTENASHEIQTPLAVIKSKIDLLIQSSNLKETELNLITTIDDACSKLIRINKSLLLLTKIGNLQFNEIEKISFERIINNSVTLFEEHIEATNLDVKINCEADFWVQMNPDLGLILISNLIQNAIRYNIKNGTIEIFIEDNKITISNTGLDKPIDSNLFERFQKDSTSNQSLGLGLSIVKEIVEVSGLKLKYSYVLGKHQFSISLQNEKN